SLIASKSTDSLILSDSVRLDWRLVTTTTTTSELLTVCVAKSESVVSVITCKLLAVALLIYSRSIVPVTCAIRFPEYLGINLHSPLSCVLVCFSIYSQKEFCYNILTGIESPALITLIYSYYGRFLRRHPQEHEECSSDSMQ
ncbi:hypothetical protein AVEN_80676-1, partial [Araneus ventricosus]